MNTIKNIIIASMFGLCLFAEASSNKSSVEDISLRMDEETTEEVYEKMHDWECNYIIRDFYHGTVEFHYVDFFIRNVDNSISFIGNDGRLWRIPSPYYWIYKNEKKNSENLTK